MPGEGTGVTRRGAVLGTAGVVRHRRRACAPRWRSRDRGRAAGAGRGALPRGRRGGPRRPVARRADGARARPAGGGGQPHGRRGHRRRGRGGQGAAGRHHARRDRHDHALRLQDALQPPALRSGQGLRAGQPDQRRHGGVLRQQGRAAPERLDRLPPPRGLDARQPGRAALRHRRRRHHGAFHHGGGAEGDGRQGADGDLSRRRPGGGGPPGRRDRHDVRADAGAHAA